MQGSLSAEGVRVVGAKSFTPLQTRLDAGLTKLVEEVNRGDPVWWRESAWIWGLPTWSGSGRPFRGLAALLLWHAASDWRVPGAWQEAREPDVPGAVVIPLRSKQGWMAVAVAPGPRLAAVPFPVPRWNDERSEAVLAALRLEERPALVGLASKVRELLAAFVQALRRQSAPQPMLRHTDWTAASLTIAAGIAATVAEAAYAAQIGKVFTELSIWQRGDVAALFPWEAQIPGDQGEPLDRMLRRKDARVLAIGARAGQLPMRPNAKIRLDRVWARGRVLEGYGRVLHAMEALGVRPCGEAVLDARALGLNLARRAARAEPLAEDVVDPDSHKAWKLLLSHAQQRAWAHRLHVLRFGDLHHDSRWHPDRIIPRMVKVASEGGWQLAQLDELPLAALGLVPLLDTMGPRRPDEAPRTADVLARVGAVSDRSYRRHAIYKADRTARWLDVPSPELARAQRRLVRVLRPNAPFAGVATAFEPGRSPALQARVHEGAVAAVIVDISDFFGSIRPRHVRWAFHPRPGEHASSDGPLLTGGTREDREDLLLLLFAGEGRTRWLPQGAPSSPWAANLAAHPMDRRLRAWARDWGAVRYSRYADDLVLSLHKPTESAAALDAVAVDRFLVEAHAALNAAIQARGWKVNEAKTRRWRRGDRAPLTLCGIEVPTEPGAPCRLPRGQHQRARAALHQLRCGTAQWDHGLLAWAWSSTGRPGWLAWSNLLLTRFAIAMAGPVLAEAFLAGWADNIDRGEDGG